MHLDTYLLLFQLGLTSLGAMAQKLLNGALLTRRFGIPRCLPTGAIRLLSTRSPAHALCMTCHCTAAGGHIRREVCKHLQVDSVRRNLATTTTLAREPFASISVGLHRDSGQHFLLTQVHGSTVAEEDAFQQRLKSCSSSRQVFTLLRSVGIMSDIMAAAALHRVADLEQAGNCLKDPAVLEKETIRALGFQLEQESRRLTNAGLVSALLACTRLFLDPWSTLMVRLVSESQERLDTGAMTVEQLCTLGLAMMAMEGPNCLMLEQVMGQIQQQEPAQWSLAELVAVYRFLQSGLVLNGKYQDLLNAMHTHALTVSSHMNPAAVSRILNTLVTLNQIQAMPLVINLCKQAVRHVPHFTDEELTEVLGALMHFGHSDHYFVDAMEKYVPTMTFTSHPETVTKVIQFFSRRNILSPTVLDAIAESFVYRADDYSTSQVARHIMALGKLGYLPPNAGAVFRKVENILHSRFSNFHPQTLLNLLHSCTLVERFPVNFVSKVFGSYFLQQLQGKRLFLSSRKASLIVVCISTGVQQKQNCISEHSIGVDRYVFAQLTQLYMTVKLECPFYEVTHAK